MTTVHSFNWHEGSSLLQERPAVVRPSRKRMKYEWDADIAMRDSLIPPVYIRPGWAHTPLWGALMATWGDCLEAAQSQVAFSKGHSRERLRLHDRWYPPAREDFFERVDRLLQPIAGPQDYPKHFPRPGETTAAAQKRSATRVKNDFVSILNPDLAAECWVEIVWSSSVRWIDALIIDLPDPIQGKYDGWEESTSSGVIRRTVNIQPGPVGFVRGEPTHDLAVEWSNSMIHMYPVAAGSAPTKLSRDLHFSNPHI